MADGVTIKEIANLTQRLNVLPGRILIWEREGMRLCAVCGEPVLTATSDKPLHVDFRANIT